MLKQSKNLEVNEWIFQDYEKFQLKDDLSDYKRKYFVVNEKLKLIQTFY